MHLCKKRAAARHICNIPTDMISLIRLLFWGIFYLKGWKNGFRQLLTKVFMGLILIFLNLNLLCVGSLILSIGLWELALENDRFQKAFYLSCGDFAVQTASFLLGFARLPYAGALAIADGAILFALLWLLFDGLRLVQMEYDGKVNGKFCAPAYALGAVCTAAASFYAPLSGTARVVSMAAAVYVLYTLNQVERGMMKANYQIKLRFFRKKDLFLYAMYAGMLLAASFLIYSTGVRG